MNNFGVSGDRYSLFIAANLFNKDMLANLKALHTTVLVISLCL